MLVPWRVSSRISVQSHSWPTPKNSPGCRWKQSSRFDAWNFSARWRKGSWREGCVKGWKGEDFWEWHEMDTWDSKLFNLKTPSWMSIKSKPPWKNMFFFSFWRVITFGTPFFPCFMRSCIYTAEEEEVFVRDHLGDLTAGWRCHSGPASLALKGLLIFVVQETVSCFKDFGWFFAWLVKYHEYNYYLDASLVWIAVEVATSYFWHLLHFASFWLPAKRLGQPASQAQMMPSRRSTKNLTLACVRARLQQLICCMLIFTVQEWFLTFANLTPKVGRPSMVSRYSTEEGKFMPTDEFHAFVDVLRAHVRGAKVRKAGSRLKGVAIEGSDSDYHIETPEEMTTMERDLILASLRNRGYLVSCKKAFTLKTASGASIDFFPQKAQWHENASVQKPGSLNFDPGAQNAIRKLKDSIDWVSSHRVAVYDDDDNDDDNDDYYYHDDDNDDEW